MGRPAILAGLIVVAAVVASAQTAEPDTAATWQPDLAKPDLAIQIWPPKVRAYGLVWLPNGTASDRTGLGAGLDTVVPYRIKNDRESLTSELAFSFTGTTKGQWRVGARTDLHWNENRNFAAFGIGYDDLDREFFGIGPAAEESGREYYGPRHFAVVLESTWRFAGSNLAVGPRLEYQHHDARDLDADGQLASGAVPGVTGGAISGLGLALTWDRRDDRYRPSSGWYVRSRLMHFDATGSSVADHWRSHLDLRGYQSLAPAHVLAWQAYTEDAGDGAPFWDLASLGGDARSRAYPLNRWLDETLVVAQAEWRWTFAQRWGAVAFGGAAVVAESFGTLQARYLRPSLGVGLRYLTEQRGEVVPLRLDLAAGYQSWRVSVGIGEAF
jgi:outer membrane protein assembly factor BamA